MSDVFNGWRRKVGVLALLMACVAMGSSIRSSKHIDSVNLLGRNAYRPFLASSQIGISVFMTPEKSFKWVSFESQSTSGISPALLERFPFVRYEGRWRWKWNGFRYGDAEYQCGPPHTRAFWVWKSAALVHRLADHFHFRSFAYHQTPQIENKRHETSQYSLNSSARRSQSY